MYQTKKTYIKPGLKMSDLIFENPSLMLMMEHFNIDIVVRNKTVEEICVENQINQQIFVAVANLYNGFNVLGVKDVTEKEPKSVILFLRNSHNYYLNEKVPEIRDYIHNLYQKNGNPEIRLVEKFFDEYSREVREHLDYEDEVAFPYFTSLSATVDRGDNIIAGFSSEEYRKHHTDIETKLGELKNLLVKHIPLNNDGVVRRKLLTALFELEYDLTIHSVIEESILIPLIKRIEREKRVG